MVLPVPVPVLVLPALPVLVLVLVVVSLSMSWSSGTDHREERMTLSHMDVSKARGVVRSPDHTYSAQRREREGGNEGRCTEGERREGGVDMVRGEDDVEPYGSLEGQRCGEIT